jgi:hypothetical protein
VSFAPVEAEKDNAAAQRWINYLANIATNTPGRPAIVQIHHTNKASRRQLEDFSAVDTRGVSALTDGPRWAAGMFPASRKVGKKGKTKPATGFVCFRVTKVNHGIYPETLYLRRGRDGYLAHMTTDEVDDAELIAPWADEECDDRKEPHKRDPKRAAKLDGVRIPPNLLKTAQGAE